VWGKGGKGVPGDGARLGRGGGGGAGGKENRGQERCPEQQSTSSSPPITGNIALGGEGQGGGTPAPLSGSFTGPSKPQGVMMKKRMVRGKPQAGLGVWRSSPTLSKYRGGEPPKVEGANFPGGQNDGQA